jgi:hypothetical protein
MQQDAGDLELHLLGWGADYPDATNFLDYHFGAGSSNQFGDKFRNLENLTAGAQLADFAARYPFYVAANEAIHDLVLLHLLVHWFFVRHSFNGFWDVLGSVTYCSLERHSNLCNS